MKDLRPQANQEFTLNQFVEAIREELESGAPPPQDGRVAEYPDARTIRYYQSIGVLDKPLRYDGRIAIYGQRHLMQALAIKALQSQGYSLAQIQRALLSTTPSELEALVEGAFTHGRSKGVEHRRVSAPRLKPRESQKVEIAPSHRDIGSGEADPGSLVGGRKKELVAYEVKPGVTVLIDPDYVEDPEETIEQIRKSLKENKQ